MKVNFWKGIGGVCENCGQPIKNVYVIEDNGVRFNCGSECVKHYLTVNHAGEQFIVNEMKKAQKYLDKKATLEKGLDTHDIPLLRKTLRDTRDEEVILAEARKWVNICDARAKRIQDEMNAKLTKVNVRLRHTVAQS